MNTHTVQVGLIEAPEINITLHGTYTCGGTTCTGRQRIRFHQGSILWQGTRHTALAFVPGLPGNSFAVEHMTIGIRFHWERQETQVFAGELHIVGHGQRLIAINRLPVEDYLTSVISSEMKATSSLEFLKAHAVISRSWLLAQMKRRAAGTPAATQPAAPTGTGNGTEHIRWYDREDHTLYDVCADDHCQRYQGIARATNPAVAEAVRQTCGEVLMYGGELCDARFSKCCGGISERFSTCWNDTDYPYLAPVRDLPAPTDNASPLPDLTREAEAERWIRSTPPSLCHTHDAAILGQILNTYDQETTDFYRWTVDYPQAELSSLIRRRTGRDLGHIVDLVPVERGPSGRLSRLRIVGTKGTLVLGKELEIRRTLSESHLFSSAFVVDKGETLDGVPRGFTLHGAGWGHGVGLCQIGAAVLGEQGWPYDKILLHYYPGAHIQKTY